MKEIWRRIRGYEGIYKISNKARIMSLKRKGVCSNRILKYGKDSNGYYCVSLSSKTSAKYHLVHRLLYSHFIGDLVNGLVIDHIDNNRSNNNLDNLQQVTARVNTTKDRRGDTSKYLGVSWCRVKEKWRTTMRFDDKNHHIGYNDNELNAYISYLFIRNKYCIW